MCLDRGSLVWAFSIAPGIEAFFCMEFLSSFPLLKKPVYALFILSPRDSDSRSTFFIGPCLMTGADGFCSVFSVADCEIVPVL